MTKAANKVRMQVIPPEKGSFPLDRQGECSDSMKLYFKCLIENSNDGTKCRDEAKSYLACRMDRNLMNKEEWANLGFNHTLPDNSIKEVNK